MRDTWDTLLAPMYAAAARFAPLIARDLMSVSEILPLLRERAAHLAPAMNASGRQARVAWALRDAVSACEFACDRTRATAFRELRPLLERRAASPALLAAVRRVNARDGNPLWRSDIEAIVDDAIAVELRRRARSRRHAA